MSKVKIYAVSGELGHEKERVFCDTKRKKTDLMEEVTITLPEGWETGITGAGTLLLCSPWGNNYMASDVLKEEGDAIWIDTADGNGLRYRRKVR